MSSPQYYVTQTNPEIFKVTPRPGGLAKIDLPPKRNRLREIASKLKKSELDDVQSVRSKSSSRKKVSGSSKDSSADTKSAGAASKKSLLTVTTRYDEPVELDMDNCPREYKVKQIIAATPWSVEFDEYLEPSDESTRIPDPFQDSVDMLAMSISVIMLMSKGYDKIDANHFKWVLSYLDCVRNEYGQLPPNVQGILNHINQLTGGKIKSFLEEYEPPELEDRATAVRISKAPPEKFEPDIPADAPAE